MPIFTDPRSGQKALSGGRMFIVFGVAGEGGQGGAPVVGGYGSELFKKIRKKLWNKERTVKGR